MNISEPSISIFATGKRLIASKIKKRKNSLNPNENVDLTTATACYAAPFGEVVSFRGRIVRRSSPDC